MLTSFVVDGPEYFSGLVHLVLAFLPVLVGLLVALAIIRAVAR